MSKTEIKNPPEFGALPLSARALLDFTQLDVFADEGAILPGRMASDLKSALQEPFAQTDPVQPVIIPSPDVPNPTEHPQTCEEDDREGFAQEVLQDACEVSGLDRLALQDELHALADTWEQALEQVRISMTQHMQAVLTDCVHSLFPLLARQFLAEEIAGHLPNLVPANMFGVEILASPDLAEKLQSCLGEEAYLPANAIIRSCDQQPELRVSVNWGEGGYDYQFEQLLARCQQRIASSQSI